MPEFTPTEVQNLKSVYEKAGQGHVFTYFDSLSESEQKAFFEQLQKVDPARVNKLRELALNPPKEQGQTVLEPLPDSANASIYDSKPEDKDAWKVPNASSFHEIIVEEGADGDGEEARKEAGIPDYAPGRKKHFLTTSNLEAFTFEKGRLYQTDFGNGYLDFNDFSLKLPGFD